MDYDKKLKKTEKRNEKFIKEFESWLKDKDLTPKTICKHISNVDLYLNYYLTYYDFINMEDGTDAVYDFLRDWFPRKCLWASATSVKETAASLKKFYQCMNEHGYVSEDDYKEMCVDIKNNMGEFLDAVNDYNSGSFYGFM